jgi:hypothetical protein
MQRLGNQFVELVELVLLPPGASFFFFFYF